MSFSAMADFGALRGASGVMCSVKITLGPVDNDGSTIKVRKGISYCTLSSLINVRNAKRTRGLFLVKTALKATITLRST